jgi:hypothetical protein
MRRETRGATSSSATRAAYCVSGMRPSRFARRSTPLEFRTRHSTTRAGGEYPTPSTVRLGQAQTRIRLEPLRRRLPCTARRSRSSSVAAARVPPSPQTTGAIWASQSPSRLRQATRRSTRPLHRRRTGHPKPGRCRRPRRRPHRCFWLRGYTSAARRGATARGGPPPRSQRRRRT